MGREPTTSKYIEVRESEIHGTGVFAKTKVSKGKKVIEYIGEKITKKESERRSIALIEKNQGSETAGRSTSSRSTSGTTSTATSRKTQRASSTTPATPTASRTSSRTASGSSPSARSRRERS